MAFLTWLPDVLRDAGCDVYVMPGAEKRSTWTSGLTLKGIVWHHTATGPNWQDGHVAALLRDGRVGLRGPLSQVGIERDGTWVIVALGRANHNGYGVWGNDSLGLEFYNAGSGVDPWPKAQYDSGIAGISAICKHARLDPKVHLKAHRETDPSRKIDPPVKQINMDNARHHVRLRMAGPVTPPTPPDDGDEELKTYIAWFRSTAGSDKNMHCYRYTSAGIASWFSSDAEINAATFLGAVWQPNLDPVLWKSLAVVNGPLKNT